MNLKKKLMASIMSMSLAAALVGGATFAYFSDSVTNANNAFAAGTLDITAPTAAIFTASNIYPGWSQTKTLDVTNNGSLDFKFSIASSMVAAGDTALYNSLTCEIKDGSTILYTGPISSVNPSNIALPVDDPSTTINESKKTLSFTVAFPDNLGDQNALQGKGCSVDFAFDAVQ